MNEFPKPIRVLIDQPALPHYRLAVFRELAAREGIELTVRYGKEPGLDNVDPDGFTGQYAETKYYSVRGKKLCTRSPDLVEIAGSKAYDCIIFSWASRNISLVPALRKARKANTATVLWGHGFSKNESPWSFWLRNRIGKRGDALLLYSKSTADQLGSHGIDTQKLFTATNCMDLSSVAEEKKRWLNNPGALMDFKKSVNIGEEDPVLLFVSRVSRENGIDRLLLSLSALVNQYPAITLVIIGNVPAAERHRLDKISGELNIDSHIRWMGPIYDESELAPWFLSSTIFCYPKNIGLSLHHAMAYGLPVLTSDDSRIQNPEFEAIQHDVNAVTYCETDLHSMTKELTRLIEDRERRARIGTEAERTMLEEITVPRMVDGFVAAIYYAMNQRRVATKRKIEQESGPI